MLTLQKRFDEVHPLIFDKRPIVCPRYWEWLIKEVEPRALGIAKAIDIEGALRAEPKAKDAEPKAVDASAPALAFPHADEESHTHCLEVKTSTIPNSGNGLFCK